MQGALNQDTVLQNYFDVLLVGLDDLDVLMSAGSQEGAATAPSDNTSADTELAGGLAAAAPRFCHILPFTVVGLRLAVARAAVRRALPWDAAQLPLAPQGPGCLWGMLPTPTGIVQVIDTAALVVPFEHPQRAAILERRRYSHILLLEGGEFGLACDALDEDILVPQDQIRWRDEASTHAWLGGTISDYGYALMDSRRVLELVGAGRG